MKVFISGSKNINNQLPFTDEYRITALKHKRFYKHAEVGFYEPMLSPLFRLRRVKPEEMTEEDEALKRRSEIQSEVR